MITLDMAQPLEAQIKMRLRELNMELEANLQITYRRGEEPEMPTRRVEEILMDIDQTERDQMDLRNIREVANLSTKVPWSIWSVVPDGELNISEALFYVKVLRNRLLVLKNMASKPDKPQAAMKSYLSLQPSVVDELTITTYSVAEYKKKASKLERQVNALSIAIDKANQATSIDFDASSYLEGLV